MTPDIQNLSLPDKLVAVAIEAAHKKFHPYYDELDDCDKFWCNENMKAGVEAALAAAFAALPEASTSDAPVWYDAEQAGAWAAGWNAALARMGES